MTSEVKAGKSKLHREVGKIYIYGHISWHRWPLESIGGETFILIAISL